MTTISQEDNLKLRQYCQKVLDKPRGIETQPNKISGQYIWCEDWEIIEVLKFLFNGRDMYYNDPPPNRLKSNPLWAKEDIEIKAMKILAGAGSIEDIINQLKLQRGEV